ncbi:MAG: hypothetical protein H6807_02170 [Planctomycetes bacterium]|nr:hypothetical protein [Planctomycetota bacterium]
MRSSTVLLLLLALTALTGCGSGHGASAWLYEKGPGGEDRLIDAEIRMETQRHRRGGPGPDLRIIRCQDGRIRVRYESPTRKEEGEADLPLADYSRIWNELVDRAGWNGNPEAADPQGGYYHYIRYRLGTRVGETSAQNRSNFLGMGTENIHNRLELANEITRLVAERVEPGPMTSPKEEGGAEP